MKNMEDDIMKNTMNFEDILRSKYGEKGTQARDKYDADSLAFRLGAMLKEARKEARITQEELALKTGVYIIDINTQNGKLSKKIIVE